ncbi:odorant receptor 43a isoform X2 [Solenopsis invicta]|uniref:odorant receptor 43a isoform X2 n=1 Tax=Solenopsis invicta TaxID=13686 RepID=UPI00193CB211|nr:odorant receptor 43a isoform X2 [Solenopsis invicta]
MDIIKPNGNADFEWATRLNRFVLNIVGIWPSAHKNAYDKFLSNLHVTFVIAIILFVGEIPAIHSLVRTWGDLLSMIDNLQFSLPFTIAIIKLIDIWWKKTASCLVVILPCFGTTVRYITNVTDPVKILPLQTQYIYDKNRSPYYELTYAAQVVLLIVTAASYSGIDNLLGLLIFHLCGQMENLKERITNMKQFKNFNSGLAVIVKDHIRLIKFFDIVESTFTILLLGLLLYFGTLFCLYGFLIVAVLTEGKKMSLFRLIYLISVVLNVCGHMCLYCVVGEILVAQCEGIYRAAYNYEWYKLNPEEARSLIIIMIRANKTLHITAGKMFPMTLSMFCNVIKTSAGYVSVLLARQG